MHDKNEPTDLEMRNAAPEKPSEENGNDDAAVLKNDEVLLNAEAESLDREAKKLQSEAPGQEEALRLAGQMSMQAEQARALATQISSALKSTSKKQIRAQRQLLHGSVATVISTGDSEVKSAETMLSSESAEHKHAIVTAVAEEKKEEKSPISHLLKKITPAHAAARMIHRAPESFYASAQRHVYSYWESAQDHARSAYHYVTEDLFTMNTVHRIGHTLKSAGVYMIAPMMPGVHVVAHMTNYVIDGTKHVFGVMGHAVKSMWPFGQDETEVKPLHAAHPAPKNIILSPQAMHAVHQLLLPKEIGQGVHTLNGESLSPLPVMFLAPKRQQLAVS